jgi:hypothetical protein
MRSPTLSKGLVAAISCLTQRSGSTPVPMASRRFSGTPEAVEWTLLINDGRPGGDSHAFAQYIL